MGERRAASTNAAQTNNDSGNTSETMSLGTTPTTSQTTSTSQLLDSGKSDLENLKPRSPDPVPAARRKPVMLLVEDNPVNMMLLATYMKKNKWEFEKASNGLIAMEAFRKRPGGFDVIFMDVSMPVMTGYESTRHIRMIETERRLAYEHQNLIQTTSPSAYLSYSTNNSAGMLPSSFRFNLAHQYLNHKPKYNLPLSSTISKWISNFTILLRPFRTELPPRPPTPET